MKRRFGSKELDYSGSKTMVKVLSACGCPHEFCAARWEQRAVGCSRAKEVYEITRVDPTFYPLPSTP
jgi:hypothetical protein